MIFKVSGSALQNVVRKLASVSDADAILRIRRVENTVDFNVYNRISKIFVVCEMPQHEIIEMNEEGKNSAVVRFKRFKTIVDVFSSSVDVCVNIIDDETMCLSSLNCGKTVMKTTSPDEFIDGQRLDAPFVFSTPAALFAKAVAECSYYSDTATSRYSITGVLLDTGNDCEECFAVGTNGKCMCVMPFTVNVLSGKKPDCFTIIPSALASALPRICADVLEEATIGISEDSVSISWEGFYLRAGLVSGRYPAWRRIVPSSENSIHIEYNRDEMWSAISNVNRLNNEKFKRLEWNFVDDNTVISTRTTETDYEYKSINLDGSANGKILLDASLLKWIGACPDGVNRLVMEMGGFGKPVKFSINDKVFVVMPCSE